MFLNESWAKYSCFKTGCIAVKRILPFFNLLDEKFGLIDWDTIQLRMWIRNKPLINTLTLPQKQNTLGIVNSIFLSFQLISLFFKKVCSLRWRHLGLINDVIEIDREQWNYLPQPGNGINFPPNHRSFFFADDRCVLTPRAVIGDLARRKKCKRVSSEA